MLSLEHIAVHRNGHAILEDVTCRITGGEIVAVLGPNGTGKTTLLRTILGRVPLSAGTIHVAGQLLHRWSARQRARHIAYVPQTTDCYDGFRVRDLVTAARYACHGALTPLLRADRVAVDAAIDRCGLTALIERPLRALSGGEQQKAWLAAALAQQAPLLLLDEPATALDPGQQRDLIALLRDLQRNDRTLIVVTHDLNLVAALNARVLALDRGRVFADEPLVSFIRSGRAQQLFAVPFTTLALPDDRLRVFADV